VARSTKNDVMWIAGLKCTCVRILQEGKSSKSTLFIVMSSTMTPRMKESMSLLEKLKKDSENELKLVIVPVVIKVTHILRTLSLLRIAGSRKICRHDEKNIRSLCVLHSHLNLRRHVVVCNTFYLHHCAYTHCITESTSLSVKVGEAL